MNTRRELNYQMYLQRENHFSHSPYKKELSVYKAVKEGNVKEIKARIAIPFEERFQGKGTLSKDPLKNFMYHFVVCTAMVTRFCMEGGMSEELAYSLSDVYIREADVCTNIKEIYEIQNRMLLDFAERMKQLRTKKVLSKQVVRCVDYIYDHLHEKISLEVLAEHVGLNASYLSILFKKETNESVSDYIRRVRIETAQNMLMYSEASYSEIANILCFSSQSHFIKLFKEHTGYTPKDYRNQFIKEFKDLGEEEDGKCMVE